MGSICYNTIYRHSITIQLDGLVGLGTYKAMNVEICFIFDMRASFGFCSCSGEKRGKGDVVDEIENVVVNRFRKARLLTHLLEISYGRLLKSEIHYTNRIRVWIERIINSRNG